MSGTHFSRSCSHSQNCTHWSYILSARGFVVFEGNTDGEDYGTKLSIPFCGRPVYLKILRKFVLGFRYTAAGTSSSSCRWSCSAFTVGRNQSSSRCCMPPEMFCIVEFCKVDVFASVPPQQPRISIAESSAATFFLHL